jgi:hypothetical protein
MGSNDNKIIYIAMISFLKNIIANNNHYQVGEEKFPFLPRKDCR